MANDYEVKNLNNLGQLKKLAARAQAEIAKAATDATNALKSATYANNTLSLFRTADHSGTAAFTFSLPEEMFLDQTKTAFVAPFTWSAETYPGSTNPNLDGKPVMVLAVKGDGTSVTYSFLDMQALVDTYSANDASVVVSGYKINVQIDDTAGNALTLVAGKGLRVDISSKADKVQNATNGNLAGLDASGNLTNSGIAGADVVTKIASPTANNLIKQDANGKIADAGIPVADVQQKLASGAFTENNFRMTDANGFAKDAGFGLATDAEVDAMLDEVFGPAV